MIFDLSLAAECPGVTKIASASKVLSRQEEYLLIVDAQLSLRPAFSKNYAKKTNKKLKLNAKGTKLFEKSTWSNKAEKILKFYPTALAQHPKTRAELQRIAKLSDRAITKLLEHNYRLIISIAKKFQGRGLSWSDLIQHGSDGFVYAVAKFDLSTGNKLSTYATQWIRQRISRAIENFSRAIRIPIHMQSIINEVKYIYRKYLERDEGAPTSEEIAQIYNLNARKKKNFQPITKEEAEEVGRHMQNITSLNEAAGDDENLTILDYIRDACPGPEGEVEIDMDKQELSRLISSLEQADQAFIKFKYGLVDGSPKSDAKAAQAFSVTMKEVKETEIRILALLKEIASQDRTNLAKEVQVYSIIAISRAGTISNEELSVLAVVEFPENLPAKIYESTDKDQMLLMKKKLECLGVRAELISSF